MSIAYPVCDEEAQAIQREKTVVQYPTGKYPINNLNRVTLQQIVGMIVIANLAAFDLWVVLHHFGIL